MNRLSPISAYIFAGIGLFAFWGDLYSVIEFHAYKAEGTQDVFEY